VPLLEQGQSVGLASGARCRESVVSCSVLSRAEDPGNNVIARRTIPKVVGGCGPAALDLASAVYATIFDAIVPVSSLAAAEMTRLLENIYRCVPIALVNELKQLCMGIDIFEVISAAKIRAFGLQAFYPGPGLGGHCIPIDPFYLSWKAKQYNFHTRFIELAGEVNLAMPYFVVDQTIGALNDHKKSLKGSRVLVFGLAYKKDIDDLRASPSLAIIELLRERGAIVFYNDPFFARVGHGRHYNLNIENTPIKNLGHMTQ
jgi:UDP-N-acetyl-D-glucosamine dehydrogenase